MRLSSLVYTDIERMFVTPMDSSAGSSKPRILPIMAGAVSVYLYDLVFPMEVS